MELALLLPVLLGMALLVVQAGLIVRDQVLLVHAAREAARFAAVEGDPAGAVETARTSTGLDRDRLRVEVLVDGAGELEPADVHGGGPSGDEVCDSVRHGSSSGCVAGRGHHSSDDRAASNSGTTASNTNDGRVQSTSGSARRTGSWRASVSE